MNRRRNCVRSRRKYTSVHVSSRTPAPALEMAKARPLPVSQDDARHVPGTMYPDGTGEMGDEPTARLLAMKTMRNPPTSTVQRRTRCPACSARPTARSRQPMSTGGTSSRSTSTSCAQGTVQVEPRFIVFVGAMTPARRRARARAPQDSRGAPRWHAGVRRWCPHQAGSAPAAARIA